MMSLDVSTFASTVHPTHKETVRVFSDEYTIEMSEMAGYVMKRTTKGDGLHMGAVGTLAWAHYHVLANAMCREEDRQAEAREARGERRGRVAFDDLDDAKQALVDRVIDAVQAEPTPERRMEVAEAIAYAITRPYHYTDEAVSEDNCRKGGESHE